MNNLEQKIRVQAIKSGALLGVIMLSLTIFSFYFITLWAKTAILFIVGPPLFSFIIPIGLVIIFCFDFRKRIGGYWNFRQATTGIFIMFIATYIIQIGGRDFVFAKLIEPHMVEKTQAAAVNATNLMMQKAHIPQEQIDKNVERIQKDFEVQKNVTVGNIIQGIAISIILIFVMALIFGALFKKEPPVFDTPVIEG